MNVNKQRTNYVDRAIVNLKSKYNNVNNDLPPLPSSADTVSELQVTLRDCEGLLRRGVVGLPGAVTRSGRPLLTFPDNYRYI